MATIKQHCKPVVRLVRPALCFLGVALLLGAGAVEAHQDKQKTRAEQFKEVLLEYQKAIENNGKKVKPAEHKKIEAAMTSKLLDLAKAAPKDDVSFQVLVFLADYKREPMESQALKLLAEHHLQHPKLGDFLEEGLFVATPARFEFIKQAADAPKVAARPKALASLGMARVAFHRSNESGDLELAKQAEQYADVFTREFPKGPPAKPEFAEVPQLLKDVRELRVGKPAPKAEGEDVAGQKVKLADLRGKVVVLYFFGGAAASQYKVAKALLEPHQTRLKGKPFQAVAVSGVVNRATMQKQLAKDPNPLTTWWDEGKKGPFTRAFDVVAYPTVVVIDAQGVIRYRMIDLNKLGPALDQLVKEAEKK